MNAVVDYIMDSNQPKDRLSEPGTPEFDREITRVLLEWVVYLEAQSFFNTEAIKAEDLQSTEKKVISGLSRSNVSPIWNPLEVSSQELKALIERKLHARKFIAFKTKSSVLPVTDAEALKYFQSNRQRFGAAPFEQFRDDIKVLIQEQQSDARITEWFSILQKKYKIRSLPLIATQPFTARSTSSPSTTPQSIDKKNVK